MKASTKLNILSWGTVLLYIVFTTILAISVFSCRSPQQISDRKCAKAQKAYELASYKWGCPMAIESQSRKDSIVYLVHDTTIFVPVPGETKYDTIPVHIKDGIVTSDLTRLDTKYAYATAQVINSQLKLFLYQKESVIAATIKDAIKKESRTEYFNITTTLPGKITNELTQWQIAQLWLGRIMIALGLLFIGFIAMKLIFKR